jgi:hypothetical protein
VSAYAAENSTAPYPLYSTTGLDSLVTHNLTMTNLGAVSSGEGNSMLLDYILSTVQLAPAGATVANYTIEDDNTTALTYSGTWGSNTNELFSGGTTRFTNGSDASVSFSFYGSAFYVYGDQNNDHGAYNVTIDGGEPEQLRTPLNCGGEFRGGYCEKTDPGVQYFKAYLGGELHNVTITNVILDRFNYSYFGQCSPCPGHIPFGMSANAAHICRPRPHRLHNAFCLPELQAAHHRKQQRLV